jgi:uncharacterized membrane protein YfcA
LFGTNKIASVTGTAAATWRYARAVRIPWRLVLFAAVPAFACAFAGAACVSLLPKAARPLVLVLLAGMLVYTLARRISARWTAPATWAGASWPSPA